MAPKGVSLHIGLNAVDPNHYGGWDGALKACEFDAQDYKAIAVERGFEPVMLLTGEATAKAVTDAISAAARLLKSGDMFLLTYAGHGGQVPDTNFDEEDTGRQDETWVLWDRQLVDDELWALWGQFRRGVRILVVSDSCHSGTVVRLMPAFPVSGPIPRIRLLPPSQAAKVYRRNQHLYEEVQREFPGGEQVEVKASVILISGCQDNQYSLDGERNGLFTETLKKVWRRGAFKGSLEKFRDSIAQRMPPNQTPNYYRVGRVNRAFESQAPFTL